MSDESTGLESRQGGDAEGSDDLQAAINGVLTDATAAMNTWKDTFDNQRRLTDSPDSPPRSVPNIITEQVTLETKTAFKLLKAAQEEPVTDGGRGSGDDEPEPIDPEPPGDDVDHTCHCEYESDTAQASGCDGEQGKHYCSRAIVGNFSSDGTEFDLDILNTYSIRDDVDLACDVDGEISDWWYVPEDEQILEWLSGMGEPPPELDNPDGFHYHVTMYFTCTRYGDYVPNDPDDGGTHFQPCGDEMSSQVDLFGICWRNT